MDWDDDIVCDEQRRRFLIYATSLMGAIGLAGMVSPFILSMWPSLAAKAAGAPVKVDVSTMKAGDQRTVMWRGKPVWIIKRDQSMLDTLAPLENQLRDPQSKVKQQPAYARNRYRSAHPDFLILIGVCTHLGCIPSYRPIAHSVSKSWPGGFFCSCHGSKFDLAGRVFKGVPAPINLEVPPYRFIDKKTILIGGSPRE